MIMDYLKKIFYKIILTIFSLFLPIISFAYDPPTTTIVNPLKNTDTLNGLIKTLLEGAVKIGMPVIVLAIVYCGFLLVQAQGKSEKIEEAKKALLYTLVGAAILLGSWAIAQLITNTVQAL
ncbi:MAG: pilin [Candidatus Paceibacterota bacterium]